MKKTLCIAGLLAALMAATGCNKLLPTMKMPFSGGWGDPVLCSIPAVVAKSALLEAVEPPLVPQAAVTNADGSVTVPPPIPATPVLTLTATGEDNVLVMTPANMSKALVAAYCAGSHGWDTCWDARVHSLKTCPILQVGIRCLTCPVICYWRSEPTYRKEYFEGAHKEKYKAKTCKGGNHAFGSDVKGADAAVSCVLVSWLFMP